MPFVKRGTWLRDTKFLKKSIFCRTKWKRQAAVGIDLLQEASNLAAVQNLIRTNPYWAQYMTSPFLAQRFISQPNSQHTTTSSPLNVPLSNNNNNNHFSFNALAASFGGQTTRLAESPSESLVNGAIESIADDMTTTTTRNERNDLKLQKANDDEEKSMTDENETTKISDKEANENDIKNLENDRD